MPREPGILEMVKRAEGGPYKTISQVAKEVGRSVDTVRRWVNDPRNSLGPSAKMNLGEDKGQFVWLYTPKDVKEIRQYARTVKPGRPRKEDSGGT